ncbi:MAG: ATP-binding protein [Crenarchaeota archaeon]|nr:ATP-binding protein [Thermoproteota archaeon]
MRLRIKNFKSLRDVDAELGKVTIVLGPPDSGKSNFLEALELLGYAVKAGVERGLGIIDEERIGPLNAYIRLTACDDLIYEDARKREAEVALSLGTFKESVSLRCDSPDTAALRLSVGDETAELRVPTVEKELKLPAVVSEETVALAFFQWLFSMATQKQVVFEGETIIPEEAIAPRLYAFDRMGVYQNVLKENLFSRKPNYPHEKGINMAWLLYTNPTLLNSVNELLSRFARLKLIASTKSFELVRNSKAVPPALASDTVIRTIYNALALLGNSADNVGGCKLRPIIMMEEPEAHFSPMPFPKVRELISKSLDKGNRVVLSTHEPTLAAEIYYNLEDVKVLYIKMVDGASQVCEVKDVSLFSDLVEGEEDPCGV